jgi:RNA recognition motif-containing protein
LGPFKFRITKANHFEQRTVHKVVLGNLPARTKFEDTRTIVTDFLSDCGTILKVKAFRDKPTDAHFSTALVLFEASDAAQLALHKTGQSIGHHVITVQPHTEHTKLGFKQKTTNAPEGKSDQPLHKKKQLKKRLREAKRNAKTSTQKVSYARKQKAQF